MSRKIAIGGYTVSLDGMDDRELGAAVIALAVAVAPLQNSGVPVLKWVAEDLNETYKVLSEEEKRRKGAKA